MPNIKFFGFVSDLDTQRNKQNNLIEKVKELFKEESWYEHTVITFEPSKVIDLEGNEQPYI